MPANRAIATVLAGTAAGLRRFPLVIAASILATIGGFRTIGPGEHEDALRIMAVATLALPLLFTITILAERQATGAARWIMFAVALAVLAMFWIGWSGWTPEVRGYRYMQLSGAFHLLAASAPFIRSRGTIGFWQYNQTLFLRFLVAALYTGVLYIGLAIALAAIEKLFGAHLPHGTYMRLWYLLGFVFSTFVFLAGVPRDLDALESQTTYPNGLRAFTQFVLVPLVAIYLVILTLYLVKVVVTQEWPSGWIGYLVSSVAIVGILSWLLVQPLEERPEYGWVKPFTRGFYIALMPAIVMLWLAIWKRVNQYGITEPRYALIVMSIWLACIAVYYTISRSRNIKLIPASLCVIALLTFAGPTGAYSVSRRSQVNRLRAVLERDSILIGGKLHRSERVLPDSDRIAISSGFQYVINKHGYRSIESWLPDTLHRALAAMPDTNLWMYSSKSVDTIMSTINVRFMLNPRTARRANDTVYVGFYSGYLPASWSIAGFTHEVHIAPSVGEQKSDTVVVDDRTAVHTALDDATIHVMRDGVVTLAIPLQHVIDSATARDDDTPNPPQRPMLRIDATGGGVTALVYITSAQGKRSNGVLKLTSLVAEVLLKLPK